MRSVSLGVLALMTAAGCRSDGVTGPTGPLPYAAAARTCGPADGPAVAIYLAASPITDFQPPIPYVSIAIWLPLDQLAGRSWSVGNASEAHAGWHSGPSSIVLAERGTIVINSVSAENVIDGSVDLTFPGGRVTGRFTTKQFFEPLMLCG